jgi:DNA-3-methyladenine glycosylase
VEVIMQKRRTLLIGVATLGLSLAVSVAPADARRGGGGGGHHAGGHARTMHANVNRSHSVNRNINRDFNRNVNRDINRNVNRNVNRDINRNVTRNVDRNRNYVWHNGRRGYWRNGVFVVAPAVAGATYVASCAYEYNRWQSTGSSYWRDRYYACSQ